MQSVTSKIWTRVAVSISYDDNHYTTALPWNKNIIGNIIWLIFYWFFKTLVCYKVCEKRYIFMVEIFKQINTNERSKQSKISLSTRAKTILYRERWQDVENVNLSFLLILGFHME